MLRHRDGELYLHITVSVFQWAPTLGGECYGGTGSFDARSFSRSFNGHPPLGVNATLAEADHRMFVETHLVSMGTHPWG